MIQELFRTALASDPRQRALLLSEVEETDPHLRAEVEALIKAHQERAGSPDSVSPETTTEIVTEPTPESMKGRSLGQYEVLSLIGRGGMGDVYLARDRRLDRKVALKMLPAAFTEDEGRLRRFITEARATSSLNHPNIITIHEIGQAGPVHFIATEFVEGHTLRDEVSRGRIEIKRAVDIASQVASALAAAHSAGIVHRDIKPENIMLRPDGYVKVLDFGLAKLTERPTSSVDSGVTTVARAETDPGTVMGTAHYLSPEQARGQAVDTRSDIFNVGVVLYEMITGRAPFEGETTVDVMASILKTEPQPLASLRSIPAELEGIISRALCKNRDERYQTSDEMLRELKALKAGMEFQEQKEASGSGAAAAPESARPAFATLPVVLGGVVAIALAGLLLWWATRPNDSATTESFSSLRFSELHSWRSERGETSIDARLSHDGSRIAFTTQKDGNVGIWVKQTVAGAEPLLITKDSRDSWWPIWSPDDQQIAFMSDRGGESGIWSAPALGGTQRLLGTVQDSTANPRYWSRNGKTIYYQWRSNLYALDVASRAITQLTSFDPAKLPFKHFSISPDEEHIVYNDAENGQIDIWTSSIRGENSRRVTMDPEEDRSPVWHPDGKRIIYTSNRGGTFQICLAYLDDRKPVQMTVGGNDHHVSDVSADGTRLIEVAGQGSADIFRTNIESGVETGMTSGIGLKLWPAISPDGRTIAFQSAASIDRLVGSTLATISSTREGGQMRFASDAFNATWSPDGSRLAFLRFAQGKVNIYTCRFPTGEEEQLTTGGIQFAGYSLLPSNYFSRDLSWSPDGRKLAYCSRASGHGNLWSIGADGSDETQLTSNGDAGLFLSRPLWSPTGERIACVSDTRPRRADGTTTWTLWAFENGNASSIFQTVASGMSPLGWSDSGNELILAIHEGEPSGFATNMRLIAVDLGRSTRTIGLLTSTYPGSIRLSPDRQTLAFVSYRDRVDNIWLMPASGGEARKLTRNTDEKVYLTSAAWSPHGETIYYSKQTSLGLITMIDNFK
ncbi:MAG TPA: protein kinase [Blastocatellia bacterium]|jgi:Tol biopolymer transport system component|nr:protein kinase [Blastocatellia bacterium]